jgi:hypothetical protein
MDGNKIIKSTKDITIIAVMTTILFVQEQLLASLPGIQLTVFLIILYSKKLGLAKSSIIIVLHVLLDNFYMSSFSLMYTPTMLIGWLIIPFSLCTIFKKVESPIILGLLGVLYSFIYCWLYIIPSYFLISIDPIDYLIADFTFEISLAVVSFVSILFLYRPCSKIFELLKK